MAGLSGLSMQAAPPEMPKQTVVGDQPVLVEEQPVGPYNQPDWTQERRFSTTRVYLQKTPWEAGFEQWWRGRFYNDGTAKHRLQEELEVGLPWRTQFDLYENWVIDDHGRARHHDVATELRWAPADWGKIPLNPTLYGEWKFVDKSQGPDVFEIKLLLGEEIAPRWHWGFNVAWEQEVGEARTTELAASQGISYTLIDRCLSAGVEMVFRNETEAGARSDAEVSFLIGPSFQWRPWKSSHLDIVPLFGTTSDSPAVEAYVVFGFDFGTGKSEPKYAPSSLRGQ